MDCGTGALWCARQRWTPAGRGACEARLGGRGGGGEVDQVAAAGSGRRVARAWHTLVRAATVQGKLSGHREGSRSEEGAVIENGRGGGGGGVPYYKAFRQLKGPQGSRRATEG